MANWKHGNIAPRLTIKNLLILVIAIVSLVTFLCISGLRFNSTNSCPVGFWVLVRLTPNTGDLVFVCPPDREISQEALRRGYFERGLCPGGYKPLVKRLVATAGDTIRVVGDTIVINGIDQGKIKTKDAQGRHLEAFTDYIRLTGDNGWFMSEYNDYSFDSRYFGPIPITSIQGVAIPILTW